MRRRLVWLIALAGLVWIYLRRGARRPEPVVQVPPTGDPADELRRKLDETRTREEPEPVAEPAREAAVLPPLPPDVPLEPPTPLVSEELDARRREVHERARSAADEMRGPGSESDPG